MLKHLVMQTVHSIPVTVNPSLMGWLQGFEAAGVSAAHADTQRELQDTLDRVSRMPPMPGDPSMQLLAKMAVLSAALASIEAMMRKGGSEDEQVADPCVRDQIIQECARAWAYAGNEGPATHLFARRMEGMEEALRQQCGLLNPRPGGIGSGENLNRKRA